MTSVYTIDKTLNCYQIERKKRRKKNNRAINSNVLLFELN